MEENITEFNKIKIEFIKNQHQYYKLFNEVEELNRNVNIFKSLWYSEHSLPKDSFIENN